MLRPSAILFDMDGLLVDSEPLWAEVEGDFARARGGAWTTELARECIGQGLANTLEVMYERFGFEVDLERDGAAIVEAFIGRVRELALMPGAAALIEAARGRVPLALGSSSAGKLVRAIVARFELGSVFGAVVSGDDVAHPKPAPDVFLECARRIGVAPEGCVVLEDSLAGIASGRAAGMRVIAVPERGVDTKRFTERAHAVAKDLDDARRMMGWT
jgi:sugar-phosphatase